MKEWYYSGLQGLCVSLARYSSAFDGGSSASALVARELFNDDVRFDSASNVSRTWRLSPPRRARMFEERWAHLSGSVRAADDVRAVLACAASLRESDDLFLTREAFSRVDDVSVLVRKKILPAMESGFTTERYPDYAVRAFCEDTCALASLVDGADAKSVAPLLVRLIAAAVYGPLHALALSAARARTELSCDTHEAMRGIFDAEGVVVMQAADSSIAQIRDVRVFSSDTVVFVGRSARLERYEEAACDLRELLHGKKREVFFVPEAFRRVSSCHGVLVEDGGRWMYYDLGSTNGTVVEGADGVSAVDVACALRPGDCLWLGASPAEAACAQATGRVALLKIAEYMRSFADAPRVTGSFDGR